MSNKKMSKEQLLMLEEKFYRYERVKYGTTVGTYNTMVVLVNNEISPYIPIDHPLHKYVNRPKDVDVVWDK